jgi:hypothetical protein
MDAAMEVAASFLKRGVSQEVRKQSIRLINGAKEEKKVDICPM